MNSNSIIFEIFTLFHLLYSYGFSNRLAVAILRLPNGLDHQSITIPEDITPPNGLTTPSNSITNFLGNIENGVNSSNNLRKDLLQSNTSNGATSTIMHADSYLNIYKMPSPASVATSNESLFNYPTISPILTV